MNYAANDDVNYAANDDVSYAVTCAVNYDVSDDVSDDEPPTRWLFFVSAAMKMTRLELA